MPPNLFQIQAAQREFVNIFTAMSVREQLRLGRRRYTQQKARRARGKQIRPSATGDV